MPLAIHVIEYLQHETIVDQAASIWDSGFWALTEAVAQRMVDEGGDFYLHTHRADPSHFGGKVLSYRVHDEGPEKGRIVFRLQFTQAHRGVRTSAEGWAQHIKRTGF